MFYWPLRTSSKQYTHVAINICRPKIHAGGVNKWIYDSEKGKKCNTLENHVCSKIFCINITTNDLLHGMFLEWWNTNFWLNSPVYRIYSYSFCGNYSFLNLEIQRSQYIRPKVTIHNCVEIIQGRKLYEEIRYLYFL